MLSLALIYSYYNHFGFCTLMIPDTTSKTSSSYFIAFLKHANEDSRHTLECSSRVVQLEATTREAAIEEAKAITARHQAPDTRLESMQIYEVLRAFEAPLSAWYQKFEADAQNAQPVIPEATWLGEKPSVLDKLKRKLGFS